VGFARFVFVGSTSERATATIWLGSRETDKTKESSDQLSQFEIMYSLPRLSNHCPSAIEIRRLLQQFREFLSGTIEQSDAREISCKDTGEKDTVSAVRRWQAATKLQNSLLFSCFTGAKRMASPRVDGESSACRLLPL
jgi:hypothetical protein